MADYLIQDTTLDAIARAINDKAGTQVAMTPAQMVTAIRNIPTGGVGGYQLLASGSYTLATQGSTVSIPVSFSGKPINAFVIYRGDGADVSLTREWGFMASLPTSELETIFNPTSDRNPRSCIVKNYQGTVLCVIPIRARIESNNTIIDVRQQSSSYPCLAGQYDWYIYGEENT